MKEPSPSSHARRWLDLADRHLKMGYALFDEHLYDGVAFHSYHAFECSLNALLTSKGYPILRDGTKTKRDWRGKGIVVYDMPGSASIEITGGPHAGLFLVANVLINQKMRCFQRFNSLRRYIGEYRKQSLYYDAKKQEFPGDRFDDEVSFNTLDDVEKFFMALLQDLVDPL